MTLESDGLIEGTLMQYIESSWKDSYVLCASLEGGIGESSLYQLSRDSFSSEKIFVTSQLFLPSHF